MVERAITERDLDQAVALAVAQAKEQIRKELSDGLAHERRNRVAGGEATRDLIEKAREAASAALILATELDEDVNGAGDHNPGLRAEVKEAKGWWQKLLMGVISVLIGLLVFAVEFQLRAHS